MFLEVKLGPGDTGNSPMVVLVRVEAWLSQQKGPKDTEASIGWKFLFFLPNRL